MIFLVLPRLGVITKMKRLAIATQLRELFGNHIEVVNYSLEEGIKSYINCDLVLTPAYEIVGNVMKYLLPQTEVIVIKRTILKSAWERILQISPGEKVLVVSNYREVAVQNVAMLYELGAHHLELLPYDLVDRVPESIEYAITPNEVELVPRQIKKIINIGDRVLDGSTLFDILNKLNLVNNVTKNIILSHMKNTMPLCPGLVYMFNNSSDIQEDFELLLNISDCCVIAFDHEKRVKTCNKITTKYFGKNISDLLNKPLNYLWGDTFVREISDLPEMKERGFIINGICYLITKYRLFNQGSYRGGILKIKKDENFESQIVNRALDKNYVAKYTFQHILGDNVN